MSLKSRRPTTVNGGTDDGNSINTPFDKARQPLYRRKCQISSLEPSVAVTRETVAPLRGVHQDASTPQRNSAKTAARSGADKQPWRRLAPFMIFLISMYMIGSYMILLLAGQGNDGVSIFSTSPGRGRDRRLPGLYQYKRTSRGGISDMKQLAYRLHPRMVRYGTPSSGGKNRRRNAAATSISVYAPHHSDYHSFWTKADKIGWRNVKNSKDNYQSEDFYLDPYVESEECIPMHEWQTQSFPSCNSFHELDMTVFRRKQSDTHSIRTMKFLGNGYFRDVFMIRDSIDEKLAVKTLRYETQTFNERNTDRHRKDALVAERLTSSPYIANIYGYCGNSALYEYAEQGTLGDRFYEDVDEADYEPPDEMEKLRVAVQVSKAISDLHTFNGEVPAVVHSDLMHTQFIKVGDVYKLNDFNRCHLMFWNSTSNDGTCPYYFPTKNAWIFRSPEELNYEEQTEKIDVYQMGNIFHVILYGAVPLEDLKEKKGTRYVQKLVGEGKRERLRGRLENEDHPVNRLLIKAIEMCWVQDWKERSTSTEVEKFLNTHLKRIIKEMKANGGRLSASN